LIRRAATLALAALATACAVAPERTPLPALAGIPSAFEMSGRLALRQGDRSDIARLRWTHTASADRWVFASPLGNEVARIESGPRGATLARAGGEPEEAADFAQLTQKLLGIALDPATLVRWLHGSAPAAGAGLSVAIEESQRAGSVDVARRLSARRGDVTVRLVVDEYREIEGTR
jgi:outer membrane biogenesis lipoprotein LolB